MSADICLILEGTYPFISGGVSSWVHQLISKSPHLSFSIIVLMPTKDDCKTHKYTVPNNVVELQVLTLFDTDLSKEKAGFFSKTKKAVSLFKNSYKQFFSANYDNFQQLFDAIVNKQSRLVSPHTLFYSKAMWELLLDFYKQWGQSKSFIDFIWACKFSHKPLFLLFDAPIPKAKAYHTVSTGYAGFLAVLAHFKTGRPFLITEHGIYTNERRIEIEQAEWLKNAKAKEAHHILKSTIPIKRLWIDFFDALSRVAYQFSHRIITLNERNQMLEFMGGADPKKSLIVPNGIVAEKRKLNAHTRTDTAHIGFVGRIVSIKDIKTFIRACKLVAAKHPKIKVSLFGPTDEEKSYFKECQKLVKLLDLEKTLSFKGKVDLSTVLADIDCMVLTSISEGQPLVILEAACYGIPVVATDVGSCLELLYGRTEADIALGQSGIITATYNPEETAAAICRLIENPNERQQMGKVANKRVRDYYSESQFLKSYHDIYNTVTAL